MVILIINIAAHSKSVFKGLEVIFNNYYMEKMTGFDFWNWTVSLSLVRFILIIIFLYDGGICFIHCNKGLDNMTYY